MTTVTRSKFTDIHTPYSCPFVFNVLYDMYNSPKASRRIGDDKSYIPFSSSQHWNCFRFAIAAAAAAGFVVGGWAVAQQYLHWSLWYQQPLVAIQLSISESVERVQNKNKTRSLSHLFQHIAQTVVERRRTPALRRPWIINSSSELVCPCLIIHACGVVYSMSSSGVILV